MIYYTQKSDNVKSVWGENILKKHLKRIDFFGIIHDRI